MATNIFSSIESAAEGLGVKAVLSEINNKAKEITSPMATTVKPLTSELSDDAVKLFEAVITAYTAGSGTATLDPVAFALLGKTFTITDTVAITVA